MEIKNENEKRENEIKIVNGTWSYIYEIWHAFGIPLIVDTVPTYSTMLVILEFLV